ncbi:MAG: hypothetical protein U0935_07975, partial [Pirellulales bacterium]
GKSARCPKCGTVVKIPGTPAAAPPATPAGGLPAFPPPPAAPSSPWAEQPSAPPPGPPGGGFGSPFGQASPTFPPAAPSAPLYPPPGGYAPQQNPYAAPSYSSPSAGYSMDRSQSLAKLKGPAIGLIVCASLSIAYALVNAVTVIVGLSSGDMQVPPEGPERIGFYIGMMIGMLGVGIVPLISLIGAIQMFRGRSYAWSLTAIIMGSLPCSACCIFGLPFGIWGYVVLQQPDVRQALQ